VNNDGVIISFFQRLWDGVKGLGDGVPDGQLAPAGVVDPFHVDAPAAARSRNYSAPAVKNSRSGELESDLFEFDFTSLLRLRSFIYLLAGTGVFLFQTHNTLAIINLAKENELLREQIQMTSSVITSQELKVHELHSIHNIAQTADALGLMPSSVPSVKLEP
jgi:hypothetical protein